PSSSSSLLTWLALLISLAALNGSLFLSVAMGLKACALCLFQQTFIMAVVSILTVGLISGVFRPGSLSLLAMRLALGGTMIAGLQVILEQIGEIECPAGILGVGTVPDQSLAVHALLLTVLLCDILRQRAPVVATVGGMFLGVGLAFFAVRSAPPL